MRSPLAKLVGISAMSEEEMHDVQRKAWARGFYSGLIDDITDDWLRLGIENHMNEKFGKRKAVRNDV
jgi:hypothetical protein